MRKIKKKTVLQGALNRAIGIKTDFETGFEDLAPEKSDIDQQKEALRKREEIQNKMEEIEKLLRTPNEKAVIHYYHISACHNFSAGAQGNQKRNRGESFFNLRNSNTTGFGNIWLSLRGVGHVWDDDPVKLDSSSKADRKWISNVRAFPELRIEGGVLNFLSVSVESRFLSYGFKPDMSIAA